jgi:hypothetical protein
MRAAAGQGPLAPTGATKPIGQIRPGGYGATGALARRTTAGRPATKSISIIGIIKGARGAFAPSRATHRNERRKCDSAPPPPFSRPSAGERVQARTGAHLID